MRPRIVERRPHVPLQQEPADCGIRVLEALTALVGRPIAATRFSAQFGLTTKGIPISQMRAMLRAFGFDADVVAIDPCRADQVRTPAAALWDGNHFVALGRTTSRGCDVFDPTRGWHVLSWREIGEHMTGLVIEVTQVPDIAPCVRAQEPSVSSWMNSLPIVKSLLLLALAAIVVQAVQLCVPAVAGQWTQATLTPSSLGPAGAALGTFVAVSVFGILLGIANTLFVSATSARVQRAIVPDLIARLFRK